MLAYLLCHCFAESLSKPVASEINKWLWLAALYPLDTEEAGLPLYCGVVQIVSKKNSSKSKLNIMLFVYFIFKHSCYGVVWYGMVWYGMVWCAIVLYGVVWCGMVSE